MMKLSFSTNAFVRHSLVEALNAIADVGFEGVEILADAPHLFADAVTVEDLNAVKKILRTTGLSVANINANTAVGYYGRDFWEPLFEPSLAHPAKELRRWRVAYTRKCIQIAAELGAPSVSITSGRPVPGVLPATSLEYLKESLREILNCAREHGVKVGIEYEPGLLIECHTELDVLLREVNSPHLGANLDLGHSHVIGEDPAAVISGLGDRIFHIHLEDIKGHKHYHLIPGTGEMDFGRLFGLLEAVGYAGFVSVELYTCPHMPVQAARISRNHLSRFLNGVCCDVVSNER